MPQIETYLYLQNIDWKWNRWLSLSTHVYRKNKQYVAIISIVIIDRWPCTTGSPVAGRCWQINWLSVWWEEQKYVEVGWPEQLRQDKNLLYRHDEPNEPTKEGPPSFLLHKTNICLSFNIQQQHLSLVSLGVFIWVPRETRKGGGPCWLLKLKWMET